jgi:hypothetical protein
VRNSHRLRGSQIKRPQHGPTRADVRRSRDGLAQAPPLADVVGGDREDEGGRAIDDFDLWDLKMTEFAGLRERWLHGP